MFTNRIKSIARFPLFVYLLPVFFVLHGFTENYYLVSVRDSLLLTGKYLLIILALHALIYFLCRNLYRAAFILFAFGITYFFFGAFHDTVRLLLPGSLFSRYVFILPFILLLLILFILAVRKMNSFARSVIYLNILFGLVLFYDCILLGGKVQRYNRQHQLKSFHREFRLCDSCTRPDIYLIVLDEYAGEKTLQDIFRFDNSPFLKQLEERKFHIIKNSFSNYNLTSLSVASLLNMDYIDYSGKDLNDIAMAPVHNRIDTNIFVPFLKFHGYEFVNNSVFSVFGQPQMVTQAFTPVSTRLITSQTLFSRLMRDLGYHLKEWKLVNGTSVGDYRVLNNNRKILSNIRELAAGKQRAPLFSYSHLTMPHAPYYFNREGKPYPESDIRVGTRRLESHYLEYLLYTNRVLTDLVDYILQNSWDPPVIILIGDHGFRYFSREVNEEYSFYNLNATFLPPQYTVSFKDSLSNISYLRSLLNLLFHQQLDTDKQKRFFIPPPKSW